jgi:hypothetical protein
LVQKACRREEGGGRREERDEGQKRNRQICRQTDTYKHRQADGRLKDTTDRKEERQKDRQSTKPFAASLQGILTEGKGSVQLTSMY